MRKQVHHKAADKEPGAEADEKTDIPKVDVGAVYRHVVADEALFVVTGVEEYRTPQAAGQVSAEARNGWQRRACRTNRRVEWAEDAAPADSVDGNEVRGAFRD